MRFAVFTTVVLAAVQASVANAAVLEDRLLVLQHLVFGHAHELVEGEAVRLLPWRRCIYHFAFRLLPPDQGQPTAQPRYHAAPSVDLLHHVPHIICRDGNAKPHGVIAVGLRDALLQALSAFKGTVVVTSHDRHFVSKLATRILELSENGPRLFNGTYEEFLERYGAEHLRKA